MLYDESYIDNLTAKVREGTLTPQEALVQFESPAKHISEVPIDNLKVDILDCGFPTLNEYMVFKKNRGELIILGARPSHGKSAFLFQIATHVAKTSNVLIYSLEMDAESIKARMIAGQTGRSLTHIQKGMVEPQLLNDANININKLNYYIDDRGGVDVRTMRGAAIMHHQKHPVGLVIVDYLQMVRSRNRNTRNEEVGDVSCELKALAKDLKCPVFVAAQLNRECERRGREYGNFLPIMSDLRESGNLEQDADAIVFLSREEVYDKTKRPGEADIVIAKQRNGKTGQEVFQWLSASTRFLDTKDIP